MVSNHRSGKMRTETRHWIQTEQNHCVLREKCECGRKREAREGHCERPAFRKGNRCLGKWARTANREEEEGEPVKTRLW